MYTISTLAKFRAARLTFSERLEAAESISRRSIAHWKFTSSLLFYPYSSSNYYVVCLRMLEIRLPIYEYIQWFGEFCWLLTSSMGFESASHRDSTRQRIDKLLTKRVYLSNCFISLLCIRLYRRFRRLLKALFLFYSRFFFPLNFTLGFILLSIFIGFETRTKLILGKNYSKIISN